MQEVTGKAVDSGITIAAVSRHSAGAVSAESLVSTNMRGEPMTPFFKDITIEREGEVSPQTARPTAHGGIMPSGGTRTPLSSRAAATRARVPRPASGKSREVWSLDLDGWLHLVITTRRFVDAPRTVALVHRRP
jgi:hypothetical protein